MAMNPLMRGMRGYSNGMGDDPAEMPPEGYSEGGPPDQYIPQDAENRLMQPLIRTQAQGQPGGADPKQEEAQMLRSQMQKVLRMRPGDPQAQRQVDAIFKAAQGNPFMQTDDILEGLDAISEVHGMTPPWQQGRR